MGQLHRDSNSGMATDRCQYRFERGLGRIIVQTKVPGGDTPRRFDGSRLDGEQRRAGQRQRAQVDHVPGRRRTVLRAVLAHRGDHDAIAQRQAAQGEGAE